MQGHSHILEFLRSRIHDDWWAWNVVNWYCRSRRMEMPKGRCHFGEIALFYAPAYFLLGVLFKIILGIGSGIAIVTSPIWRTITWFFKRVERDTEVHKARLLTMLIAAVVLAYLTLFVAAIADTGILVFLTTVFSVLLVTFFGGYLVTWLVEANMSRLQPAFELGREAALALRSPTARQVMHAVTTPVRAVPAAVRSNRPTLRKVGRVAITPAKVLPAAFRAGRGVIRGSRDFGVILFILAKDGWRKVCPLAEYIHHDGPSTSERTY